jgi:hypothetical protein
VGGAVGIQGRAGVNSVRVRILLGGQAAHPLDDILIIFTHPLLIQAASQPGSNVCRQ